MSVQGKVEIRRSARRKRTVSARREGDVTVILMPAGLSAAREAELVDDMLGRLERSERRRRGRAGAGDEALEARAREMSDRWLGGAAQPASVRWVPVMRSRWASCTQTDGTIRVSEAARRFPAYVLDYLLVHELAHLVAPGGHTPRFWELVRRYPRTERAIGFLEASSVALRDPAAGAWGPHGADDCDDAAACDGSA
ncbi:M48 family metallopeptidase [Tomitella fengzijianii]|uniref:M48 metallopeptidase family protein n=1 Tax=Tomitella fengzijianii TaxID=2597660 RepID=UPI001E589482|nr:M48 family metallopeptidase [Tomitella fengzijianii]